MSRGWPAFAVHDGRRVGTFGRWYHIAPEPCVVSREGQGEASAGDRAGWSLSRERVFSRTPTGVPTWKAIRLVASSRAAGWSGVVRDPSMRGDFLPGNRE